MLSCVMGQICCSSVGAHASRLSLSVKLLSAALLLASTSRLMLLHTLHIRA